MSFPEGVFGRTVVSYPPMKLSLPLFGSSAHTVLVEPIRSDEVLLEVLLIRKGHQATKSILVQDPHGHVRGGGQASATESEIRKSGSALLPSFL